MENNNNSTMGRAELRKSKKQQRQNEQYESEPKKQKKKRHRHHRFWLWLFGIIVIVIAIFFWIGSRSALTGSWVEISNSNGTTYASTTDIDTLSTLTLKHGKYTYTPSNVQTSATTGKFKDDSSNNQVTLDDDTISYTLSADNDQVTFTSSSGTISGLGGQSSVTFVRTNSSEYKRIKEAIADQNESSASSASSSSAAESSSNKLSSAISGLKDKVTGNSSSSDSASTDSSSTSTESSSAESATEDSSTQTNVWDKIQNQIQSWLNGVGVQSN